MHDKQYMRSNGLDDEYDKFIASIYSSVTFETQRYVFGFLLNEPRISYQDFLRPRLSRGHQTHSIRTQWVIDGKESEILVEKYLNNTVAPTSVLMWFWRRTHQCEWLEALLLTGFNWQHKAQFRSFMQCNFDFYTVERFVFISYVYRMYILCISYVYRMYIVCLSF